MDALKKSEASESKQCDNDWFADFKDFLEFATRDILDEPDELPKLFWGNIQVKLTPEIAEKYVNLSGKEQENYILTLYQQLVLSQFPEKVDQIN